MIYLLILVCTALSLVIGFVWYGPLFGKLWLKVIKADDLTLQARAEMQKKAKPLYFLQFLMTVVQVSVLAILITGLNGVQALNYALLAWLGFVVPILAGSALWNNDSKEVAKARFLIQAGYQLVLFVVFGLILGFWA